MLRPLSSFLVAAGLGAGTLAFGGVAAAATTTCPPYGGALCAPATSPGTGLATQPATSPADSTTSPAVATAAASSSTTATASTLPFTGADVAGTAGGGALAIAVGAVLVRASRRRRA
jgi:hypothetical protein